MPKYRGLLLRRNRRYGKRMARRGLPYKASRIGSYKKYAKAARVMNRLANRIPRALTPFPQQKIVRHKYAEIVTLPAGAAPGVGSFYAFRANSTYDPNKTGTGHQPMYRDELAANYAYYTVIASFIKVTWDPEDPETMVRTILLTEDTSWPTALDKFAETYQTSTPQKASQLNRSIVSRKSYNAGKYYKTTQKAIMADEDKRTASGNNPSFGPDYVLARHPVDPTVTLGTSVVTVEIVYITVWREHYDSVQS